MTESGNGESEESLADSDAEVVEIEKDADEPESLADSEADRIEIQEGRDDDG